MFVAGLLDRAESSPPSLSTLDGSQLLIWGQVHVKTIQATGGQILGRWEAVSDLNVLTYVSHRAGGKVGPVQNGVLARAATTTEASTLPVMSTWGFTVIQKLAERSLVRGEPLPPPAH